MAQLHAGPNLAITIANNAAFRCQFLGQGHQLAVRCLAEPTIGKLPHTVRDGANKQIAAHPRRFVPIEPAPLVAQLLCGEIG
jgi:hypothetical protein